MCLIGLSKANVQKELAEEEESRLAAGGVALHKPSPLSFIVFGLELEDTQCVLFLHDILLCKAHW